MKFDFSKCMYSIYNRLFQYTLILTRIHDELLCKSEIILTAITMVKKALSIGNIYSALASIEGLPIDITSDTSGLLLLKDTFSIELKKKSFQGTLWMFENCLIFSKTVGL